MIASQRCGIVRSSRLSVSAIARPSVRSTAFSGKKSATSAAGAAAIAGVTTDPFARNAVRNW